MDPKIHEIIKKHTTEKNFDSDSDLQMDLGLDSLNIVNLAVELEDAFGVKINISDVYNLLTVGDIEKHIKARLCEK